MSIFNKVRLRKPPRSTFDLSHEVKTTCDFGTLVPIMCEEVVPGDTFSLSSQLFCRVAPMVAPIMSKVNVYTHFFFVPYRLVWDHWEAFITGGQDGKTFPEKPWATLSDVLDNQRLDIDTMDEEQRIGGLADYLGLPIHLQRGDSGSGQMIDLLPFFAYQKIWNDWYRDQNLQNEVVIPTDQQGEFAFSSLERAQLLQIRQRCWKKDYFTSALPWPQRGEDVHLPMEGKLPGLTVDNKLYNHNWERLPYSSGASVKVGKTSPSSSSQAGLIFDDQDGQQQIYLETKPQDVNFSSIAPTILETRRAFKVQEWLERNAVGGSRYIEQILSHFGVRSSDARLQRPELLGGGKTPIIVSEVVQTSETSGTPQGNMAGHGVSAQATHRFKRYFEEHGLVIGIMSIMPITSYMQGINKMWQRFDKFDYLWPEFANIGEQEIKNKEVAVGLTADDAYPEKVFGYTPRYSEYKYRNNRFGGEFRASMLNWHLGRVFGDDPILNSDFVTCNNTYRAGNTSTGELDRIFAYTKGHHFWVQVYHNLIAKRPLPYYGETHI